jgi:hypothetical protein
MNMILPFAMVPEDFRELKSLNCEKHYYSPELSGEFEVETILSMVVAGLAYIIGPQMMRFHLALSGMHLLPTTRR